MVPRASIGTIVHYSFSRDDLDDDHKCFAGMIRPAIVVQVWINEFGTEPGYNLQVFTDGRNDGFKDGTAWFTSKELVEVPTPGKCHWPVKE